MKTSDLQNKKIAILGLGIEGIALANYFDSEGIIYSLLDLATSEKLLSRAEDDGQKELVDLLQKVSSERKIFGEDYLNNLKEFDVIFRSPGIPYLHQKIQEARESGATISSQIKFFFDLCPAPIIGVTGTKGKGTTASLIQAILHKAFQETRNKRQDTNKLQTTNHKNVYLAGNIGTPAITLLKDIGPEDWVILELSSFQLQDLEKSPHIATVLNISIDHLDYHEDEAEYHEAKQSIVKYQTASDFAIINQDYLTSFEFAALTDAQKYYFSQKNSVEEGAYVRLKIKDERLKIEDDRLKIKEVVLRYKGEETVICRSDEIALVGEHNLANIAAAAITARIVGVDLKTISEVSKSFKGLPHRIEFVKEIGGVKFYNDSFATNPDPTMAAIDSFVAPKIIILGGSSKGADFSELADKISISNVKACVLIGSEAKKLEEALRSSKFKGVILNNDSNNIDEIVRESMKFAKSGDIIILSPACASFGMFKNYKDRGCKFRESVERLNV